MITLGDIHGDSRIIHNYLSRGYLNNKTVYQVGDFGLYDLKTCNLTKSCLEDIDAHCKDTNTKIRVIRGNHDNPKFWLNDDERILFNKTYSNIELIPDYHIETIDGKSIMFIGGGVSIDRRFNFDNDRWWPDEVVFPPIDGIDTLPQVDVVISHTTTNFFNNDCNSPQLKFWIDGDDTLLEDLVAERQLMDMIFMQVRPKQWVSGHFHNNKKHTHNGCDYRCVNIKELYELL